MGRFFSEQYPWPVGPRQAGQSSAPANVLQLVRISTATARTTADSPSKVDWKTRALYAKPDPLSWVLAYYARYQAEGDPPHRAPNRLGERRLLGFCKQAPNVARVAPIARRGQLPDSSLLRHEVRKCIFVCFGPSGAL